MSHTQASSQVVLVIENPDLAIHATAALRSCGGLTWVEVDDCTAAAEWLCTHSVDLVLVLLQSTPYSSLSLLRQVWHGPLVCLCDDDEDVVSAVEAAQGYAVLPPFAMRQIRSALRLLLPQTKWSAGALTESPAVRHGVDEQLGWASQLHVEHAPRQSERELEQARRMEAVGRLAGGIAHDFNNLLTVISSYSDLSIRKLEEGHVVARYVEQIRKASDTAAKLTSQLLAFGHYQVLQPRVVELNEIVDEMSMMVQSLLGTNIELRMRLDPLLGQVKADPVQLQQVLLNLIMNAKDAMPNGGLINIETRNDELDSHCAISATRASGANVPTMRPGSYVRLTVADTGCGMDAATLTRIYEPFFTTKPKGRGTGLGLLTIYNIVQQYGGYIRVHSEVGQGTTFHIFLPRVDAPRAIATGVDEDAEPEVTAPVARVVV